MLLPKLYKKKSLKFNKRRNKTKTTEQRKKAPQKLCQNKYLPKIRQKSREKKVNLNFI